jgi:acetate kinase
MSDFVLVVNAGSSSLKYSLVDAVSGTAAATGHVERIGETVGEVVHEGSSGEHRTEREIANHEDALRAAMEAFTEHGPSLDEVDLEAVGHRVVHGGARFSEPVLVDDALVAKVKELIPLAPLHNPANLEGIATSLKLFPDVPQVAVFDTAFHSTLPPEAYTYAVPRSWVAEHRIRRYGFHGTSYSFVSGEAARLLGRPPGEVNLIVLHLGNGASAAAIRGGESVDTSMGLTPLEGLVMGTRSGDIDPALHAHLHRQLGWALEDIDGILNRESGLKGLSGHNDFREVERLRAHGWHSRCTATASGSTSAPTTPCSGRSTRSCSPLGWGRTPRPCGPARWQGWSGSASRSIPRATRGGSRRRPWCHRTAATSRCWSYPPTRSGRSPARRWRSCTARAESVSAAAGWRRSGARLSRRGPRGCGAPTAG